MWSLLGTHNSVPTSSWGFAVVDEALDLLGPVECSSASSFVPQPAIVKHAPAGHDDATQPAVEHSLFFPSCVSVALTRSSHIVVLINELSGCNCNVPSWVVESRVGTITQSEVKSGPKHRENKKTTKAKTRQKQKTNQTTQTAKRALTSQLQ